MHFHCQDVGPGTRRKPFWKFEHPLRPPSDNTTTAILVATLKRGAVLFINLEVYCNLKHRKRKKGKGGRGVSKYALCGHGHLQHEEQPCHDSRVSRLF